MKRLRNSSGQMTIEALLIMLIMFSIFNMVHKKLSGMDTANKIIGGPWDYVQGMVENGVWDKADRSRNKHPNSYARRASPEPL